jgi:YD repeat-containing protein
MFKRFLVVFIFAFISHLLTSLPASAQVQSGCLINIIWYIPDPIPFGFYVLGPAQGPFSIILGAASYLCGPSVLETRPKICPAGSGGSNSASAGAPICLSTGNTEIDENDLRIPGLGGGLSLSRTWNSTWPPSQSTKQVGIFGSNWRSTYEEFIFTGNDGYLKYSRSNGDFWSFGYDSSSSLFRVAAPANAVATISQGSTFNTLTFQSGEQRRFDNSTGKLIAIVDRNGNVTSLTYDSLGRLVTVTDPASRSLTFSYAPSSYVVAGVSSSVGTSVTYGYDTQGRLSTVTEQDLSSFNFTYNSQSLITQVTDSLGKVLETHTYDSIGRGLTSARANGVEALTVTYP